MAELSAVIRARLIDEASAPAARIAAALRAVSQASRAEATARQQTAEASSRAVRAQVQTEEQAAAARIAAEQKVAREALARSREQREGFAERQRAVAALIGSEARASAEGRVSQGAVAEATKKASLMTLKGTEESKKMSRALAQQFGAAAELAGALGPMSHATRGVGIAFLHARHQAFALSMTMGPLAVIAMTAINIFPSLAKAIGEMASSTDHATNKLKEQREAFVALTRAAREAREEEQRRRSLLRGDESVAEQDAALATARRQAAAAASAQRSITEERGFGPEWLRRSMGYVVGASAQDAMTNVRRGDMMDTLQGVVGATLPDGAVEGVQRRRDAIANAVGSTAADEKRYTQALAVAQERAGREEAAREREQAIAAAQALREQTMSRLQQSYGPSRQGRQRFQQLQSAMQNATLDSSQRVVLDAGGSRALQGLPADQRASETRALEEVLQAERRVRELQARDRAEAAAAARARNLEEQQISPTARPDIALRTGGGATQEITRYIEAETTAARAAGDELLTGARELTRAAEGLREIRVVVDDRRAGADGGGLATFLPGTSI